MKVALPSLTSTASASVSEVNTERLSAKYPSSAVARTVTSVPTSTVLDIWSVPSNERVPFTVSVRVTVAVSGPVSCAVAA